MNEAWEWRVARIKADIRRFEKKLIKKQPQYKNYAGRDLLNIEAGAKYIHSLLTSNDPCMICRYGSTELDIMTAAIAYPDIAKRPLEKRIEKGHIYTLSGFFPEGMEYIMKFSELMIKASEQADYIGVWFNPMEDYIIEKCAGQSTKVGVLRSIEPWYAEMNIWTEALKSKKVLVIHPFSATIQNQYLKREELFLDKRILPEFTLITQRAIQTVAGEQDDRFTTWFEALDYMYEEAMKVEFDIAILGCGAYGFPLAAKLKSAGKKAIHMGGSTQLLFGVKGGRWDNHPVISKLYNKAWERPNSSEKPTHADKVENGCYW